MTSNILYTNDNEIVITELFTRDQIIKAKVTNPYVIHT